MQKRCNLIKKYIEGKEILDIGCIGDFPDLQFYPIENGSAPMNFMSLNAKKYVGIDYDLKRVRELNDKGYHNIIWADAQCFALEDNFDVIFAGELIEHLPNPGQFLDNVSRHLKNGGFLILSTPNVFSINHILRGVLGIQIKPYHEHTHWHCERTLAQLLKQYGFKIVEKHYLNEDYGMNKGRLFIMNLLSKFNKRWRQTMLFVCQKEV